MLVEPKSPDVLVWLVNEWGSVPRAAAGEDQAPYPDTDLLAALLAGSGVRDCPPAALTGPALRQVADQLHRVFAAADLAEHDPDRIGICSGRHCADAFIDASPAGQRRFCSVTCQNRARIAAWRHRQSQPPQRRQPQRQQP